MKELKSTNSMANKVDIFITVVMFATCIFTIGSIIGAIFFSKEAKQDRDNTNHSRWYFKEDEEDDHNSLE